MTKIGIAVDGDWLWEKLNDALDNAPTIEPARKNGKWVYQSWYDGTWTSSNDGGRFVCDQCGYENLHEDDYCGGCGADMRGEKDETD